MNPEGPLQSRKKRDSTTVSTAANSLAFSEDFRLHSLLLLIKAAWSWR